MTRNVLSFPPGWPVLFFCTPPGDISRNQSPHITSYFWLVASNKVQATVEPPSMRRRRLDMNSRTSLVELTINDRPSIRTAKETHQFSRVAATTLSNSWECKQTISEGWVPKLWPKYFVASTVKGTAARHSIYPGWLVVVLAIQQPSV